MMKIIVIMTAVLTVVIFNEGVIDFNKAGGKGSAQISFLHLIL
jgi:hypothetical protein